jgi:hypothetical protein
MEATFFTCPREDAVGVSAIEDLPCEPAGEPLRVETTKVFTTLARALSGDRACKLVALRDATCRSFPVLWFPGTAVRALAALDDVQVDELAERWLDDPAWQGCDVDLYEVCTLIGEIRLALVAAESADPPLFVLLEEKAL